MADKLTTEVFCATCDFWILGKNAQTVPLSLPYSFTAIHYQQEVLRQRRPPWPKQIITPRLFNVSCV